MNKQEIVQLRRTLHRKATLEEYGLSSVPEWEEKRAEEARRRQEEEEAFRKEKEAEERRREEDARREKEEAESARRRQEEAESVRRRQEETIRQHKEEAERLRKQEQERERARRRQQEERYSRKKSRPLMPVIILLLILLSVIGWGIDQGAIPPVEELFGRVAGVKPQEGAVQGGSGAAAGGAAAAGAAGASDFARTDEFVSPFEYGKGTAAYGDSLCITNRMLGSDYVGERQEIAVIPWPGEIGEERFQITWDLYSLNFTRSALGIRYAYEAYEKSAEEYLRKKGLINSLEDARTAETESGDIFYYVVTDEETEGFVTTDRKLTFTAASDRAGRGVFICTYERRYNSSQEVIIGLDSASPELGMASLSARMAHSLLGGVSFVREDLVSAGGASPMDAVTLRDLSDGITVTVSHGVLRNHGADGTEEWRETVYWNSFEEASPRSAKVTYDGMKADRVEYVLQDTYYAKAEDYPVLSSSAKSAAELIQDEVRSYSLGGYEVKAQLVHYLSGNGTEYTEINAWLPLTEDVILTGSYKTAHYDFGDYPEFVEDVDTLRANMDEIVTEMMGTCLKITVP